MSALCVARAVQIDRRAEDGDLSHDGGDDEAQDE